MKLGFVSLGCAKNLVDSQLMAGALLADGISLAPRPEEADVVLVNTCSFIDEARKESIAAVRDACRLKAGGRVRAVIVAGCLPQRYGKALRDRLPDVDAFVGLDEIENIAGIARRLARGESGIFKVSRKAERLFEPRVGPVVFTGGPFAYLKIAEGCNHRCSFCAIPGIRGSYRSRPPANIVREAGQLLEHGFRELNLVSQDTTMYGCDIGGGLPELVRALGAIGGKFWIRLLYGYPSRVTDELLDAMAGAPQVCRYLDIPVQHSHPEILQAMGRAETAGVLSGIVERIRRAMPDAVLRTTCLVGFPGETESHFRHLLEFVRETRFDHLGVFVFSPEDGTPARSMAGRPSRGCAIERQERLLLAQSEIVGMKAAALAGAEAEVLLEKKVEDRDSLWLGRSARQAPEVDGSVFLTGAGDAAVGDFARARYTGGRDYDLEAVALA